MTRFLATVAVAAVCAAPCQGRSYRVLSLPELVARADVIVVGRMAATGGTCRITVARTLAGKAGPEVAFPGHPDAQLTVGATRLLFLTAGKSGLALVYPLAVRESERADEVARLVAMRTDPARYVAEPAAANTPEFLETLGWAFASQEKVGALDRPTVIAHIRGALGGWEPEVIVAALASLRQVGDKNATAVVPLVRHRAETVKLAAIRFLEWTADKSAVAPLCEVLDGINGGPGHSPLEDPVGRALIAAGDPAAVPALERAVRRGVDGTSCWALGRLGGKTSGDLLTTRIDRGSGDAGVGMAALVRRSNKPFEPWMDVIRWSPETGLDNKAEWRRWWDANRASFEVVRTAAEAFRKER